MAASTAAAARAVGATTACQTRCEIASLVEVKAGDERLWQATNSAFTLRDGKVVNILFTQFGQELDHGALGAPVAAELWVLRGIGYAVRHESSSVSRGRTCCVAVAKQKESVGN